MNRFLGVLTVTIMLFAAAPGDPQAQAANPVVVIETSLGDITVELDRAKAPLSVDNFLAYAKSGHYNGTIFHRVIKGFMIQGGGMTADMKQKPTRPPIKNEAGNGLKNVRGTIAAARTGIIDSATSQFYINTVNNAGLDHKNETSDGFGYAVFGKVTAGMDVADKIEGLRTRPGDVPVETVTIKGVRIK